VGGRLASAIAGPPRLGARQSIFAKRGLRGSSPRMTHLLIRRSPLMAHAPDRAAAVLGHEQ
jgi:hypothetical protein